MAREKTLRFSIIRRTHEGMVVETLSVEPLSKQEKAYLENFTSGKAASYKPTLQRIVQRIYAEFLNHQLDEELYKEPINRKLPFVFIGTADVGYFSYEPRQATLSQLHTEEGYLNLAGELVFSNRNSNLNNLNPSDNVFGITSGIEQEPLGIVPKWKREESKETSGMPFVSFAAAFSSRTLGLKPKVLAILVGITDGVSDDGSIIEVRQSDKKYEALRKERADLAKMIQANIYSVILGAKKWRCIFSCRDGRFVVDGEADKDKAFADLGKALDARINFSLRKDPVYVQFGRYYGWKLKDHEYEILKCGIEKYGKNFITSMKSLSGLREYGFSISNIDAIRKSGIRKPSELDLETLMQIQLGIRNGLSKVVFQQAARKWAEENGFTYINQSMLSKLRHDKIIFYDIEYLDAENPILFGFLSEGVVTQYLAGDHMVVQHVKVALDSGCKFVSYGTTDKGYIEQILDEANLRDYAQQFASTQADMLQLFSRGYALKTSNKRLCAIAELLLPQEFGDACKNEIDITQLVDKYVATPKGTEEHERLLEEIKNKNKKDLMEMQAIYKWITDKLMSRILRCTTANNHQLGIKLNSVTACAFAFHPQAGKNQNPLRRVALIHPITEIINFMPTLSCNSFLLCQEFRYSIYSGPRLA
ncbi:MAG: hypothetical protein ACP5TF_03145 [Candidatus Acidifodinimicrobium sp.]